MHETLCGDVGRSGAERTGGDLEQRLASILEGDQRPESAQLRRGRIDGRQFTEEAIAYILRISMHKVDWVKKRFVEEGLDAALGSRQRRRPKYICETDGE